MPLFRLKYSSLNPEGGPTHRGSTIIEAPNAALARGILQARHAKIGRQVLVHKATELSAQPKEPTHE